MKRKQHDTTRQQGDVDDDDDDERNVNGLPVHHLLGGSTEEIEASARGRLGGEVTRHDTCLLCAWPAVQGQVKYTHDTVRCGAVRYGVATGCGGGDGMAKDEDGGRGRDGMGYLYVGVGLDTVEVPYTGSAVHL